MTITIPHLHLGRGENDREHPFVKAKRVRVERGMVFNAFFFGKLRGTFVQPDGPPYRVILTRVAPSDGLDSDNLVSSLKHVRDQAAICLGLVKLDKRGREIAMDGPRDPIAFECRQEKGPWGVKIEVQGVAAAVAE